MHSCGQTRPYEIIPNKTNFGLSFGHFLEQKREEGRRREEEEEEKEEERYGSLWILVWIYDVFVCNLCGSVVWILMVPFLGFSKESILTLDYLKVWLVKP